MDQAEGLQKEMEPPQMDGTVPGHRSNTHSSEDPGEPGMAPPITLPKDAPTIITDKSAHADPNVVTHDHYGHIVKNETWGKPLRYMFLVLLILQQQSLLGGIEMQGNQLKTRNQRVNMVQNVSRRATPRGSYVVVLKNPQSQSELFGSIVVGDWINNITYSMQAHMTVTVAGFALLSTDVQNLKAVTAKPGIRQHPG